MAVTGNTMALDQTRVEAAARSIEQALRDTGDLDRAVEQYRNTAAPWAPDRAELEECIQRARGDIERRLGRLQPLHQNTLRGSDRPDWYLGPPDAGHWASLRDYLILPAPGGKGWDEASVGEIDRASTQVVRLLDPPRPAQSVRFSTRGLVVGHVQSGKTANMTAVVAKAVDAGYRLVIVLAGMTNALREQTQARFEQDLIARNRDGWSLLTQAGADIDTGTMASLTGCSPGEPRLAVVKKNGHVLQRLVDILARTPGVRLGTCPALILDDESDQASVNTGRDGDLSTINRRIREILGLLPKVAYVGYTATPFANVLIDPSAVAVGEDVDEDLYPGDFIIALDPPPAYFGAERLFGRYMLDTDEANPAADGLDMLRTVPHDEAQQLIPVRDRPYQPAVSGSLETALRWFLIATAARGPEAGHSTMLVHTSQLVEAHWQLAGEISGWIQARSEQLAENSGALMAELRDLWEQEYGRVAPEATDSAPKRWNDFKNLIPQVIRSLRVVVENSQSDEGLNYSGAPKRYIAVGGNILSRGLTIEGLIVSFFLRGTGQYDTLMQMGRWFGYRPGYGELARLWTSERTGRAFRDLATVEAEVREEIALYSRYGYTPRQLAVRIRQIPGMMITAPNKMRAAGIARLSYAGQHVQTFRFYHRNRAWLDNNWAAGSRPGPQAVPGGRVFRNVAADLITDFLTRYQVHEDHHQLARDLLLQYIRDDADGSLAQWNVALIEPLQTRGRSRALGAFGPAVQVRRARLNTGRADDADIKALISRRDLLVDLDAELRGNPSWTDIKTLRQSRGASPLLLLYAIEPLSEPRTGARSQADDMSGRRVRVPLDAVTDVLGVALVFPDSDRPEAARYVSVNLDSLPTNAGDDDG
jgi:hypothetical protein